MWPDIEGLAREHFSRLSARLGDGSEAQRTLVLQLPVAASSRIVASLSQKSQNLQQFYTTAPALPR